MKSLFTFTFFLLLFAHVVPGQDYHVALGPEFTASKKIILSDIVGTDKTGYYVLQSQYRGMKNMTMIAHFNNDLTLTKQVLLEPTYEGKELDIEGVYYLNDKIFLFTSFSNQKLDKKFLFYQTVDKTTLTPNKDLKKINEVEYTSKYNSGSYSFKVSRDSSKIIVLKHLPYEKLEAERFEVTVYGENMQALWNRQITLPYLEKLFKVSQYIVGNNGNVYVLGRLYEDVVKEKRFGEVNYQYKILSYFQGQSSGEYSVSLGDKFITDLQLEVSEDGQYICTGFYSEKGTFSIKGTYYLKIDGAAGKVIKEHKKEFPTDFLTQYETEKEAKKIEKKEAKGKNTEMYEFDLDELIIREDGGAYLVGEQYYVRVVTYTTTNPNGGTSTHTTYYYNYHDIIVISFSPEGAIEWYEKVPKRQVSANDGGFYSSYVHAVNKDRLYLIFNDHFENQGIWKTGKLKNYTAGEKGVVTMVVLGLDGSQERKMLYKAKDIESITVPKVCRQIDESTVIIYGKKKTTHQFSKLTFAK